MTGYLFYIFKSLSFGLNSFQTVVYQVVYSLHGNDPCFRTR